MAQRASIFKIKDDRDALCSANYSLMIVIWILYHSLVMLILPSILIAGIYGSTKFFKFDDENAEFFFFLNDTLHLLLTNVSFFSLSALAFRKDIVIDLGFKIILSAFVSSTIYKTIRLLLVMDTYDVSNIVSLVAWLFFLKKIPERLKRLGLADQAIANTANPSHRDVLSGDGTCFLVSKLLFFCVSICCGVCVYNSAHVRCGQLGTCDGQSHYFTNTIYFCQMLLHNS